MLKNKVFKYYTCVLLFIFLFGSIIYAQETPILAGHMFSVTQGLRSPVRIAIDNDDVIYVTDASQKCISKYDATGVFLGLIKPGGEPISIAINTKNQVFVGDAKTGAVLKLDKNGLATEFYTETEFPSSMIFGTGGLLYVVDSKLMRVLVIDSLGNLVNTIGNDILLFPTGIAYNHTNNQLYVSEHGGIGTGFKPLVKIWVFDLQGNLLSSFGSHGNGDGQFYRIQGLAVDRCGKIYAIDPFQATISVFDEAGFITKFGEYGNDMAQLNIPMGLAFDSKGQLWVSSMNNAALEVYNVTETQTSSHIISSDTSICSGQAANIAIRFTGMSPWTFTYTVDGLNPVTITNTNDNPYNLTVSETGTYEVIALSDANAVATCLSGTVDIQVNPLPIVNLGEDVSICEGEVYTIDAGGAFASYLWSDNSTNQTLDVSTSGNYKLTVTDSNTCENSDELNVLVRPIPVAEFTYTEEALEISFSNTSANADSYFWDFDDGQTSEEINPVHLFNTPGEYDVVLTAYNENCGSSSFSQHINILATQVKSVSSECFVRVFPNPSNGIFTIEINNPVLSGITLEITNISGQKVYKKEFKTGEFIDEINLSRYPKGIYTLQIISIGWIKTDKIIIN